MNVSELIREVLDTTSYTEPGDVASAVFNMIDEFDYGPVLVELLREKVRVTMASRRSVNPSFNAEMKKPVKNNSATSAKVRMVRETWRARLRDRIYVPGVSEWKMFGDLTRSDLDSLIHDRLEIAKRNIRQSDRFGRFVALLKESGAEKVSEIPGEALAQMFS